MDEEEHGGNIMAAQIHPGAGGGLSLAIIGYYSKWNSTDQILGVP
jgi:hypothetical protein